MNIKRYLPAGLLGLFLQQAAFGSSCEFKIKNARFFTQKKQFQIKISFKRACSKNSFYKRSLETPKLELFQNNRLVSSLSFNKGYWHQTSGKFHFMSATRTNPGCKKLKNLTLDLKQAYLTSLSGNYLNLERADFARWKCRPNPKL